MATIISGGGASAPATDEFDGGSASTTEFSTIDAGSSEPAPELTGVATIRSVTIYLSGKPVVVELNDLATSGLSGSYRIGTGDIRLPVSGKFAKINTVFITLQNVGAGWSYELIDKTTTYGPRIKIYNASGVPADATIDAYIKGL